jgi:hypothetical protein
MNIFPLICPHCLTVAVFDTPPKLGEPRMCPCLDRPPITQPVAFMRLKLPEGYEVTRKVRA